MSEPASSGRLWHVKERVWRLPPAAAMSLLLWIGLAGLASAPIQGYRLMIPGDKAQPWVYSVLPWSLWEHRASYATFMECEEARLKLRQESAQVRREMETANGKLTEQERAELQADPELRRKFALLGRMWARIEYAECQGVR